MIRRATPLLLLVVLLAACGANQRRATLDTTYEATNAAKVALRSFSKEHEASIIKQATSYDDGRKQLDEFRSKVDKAVQAVDDVYRAIELALLLDTDRSMATALNVFAELGDQLKELGVKP